MSLSDDEDNYFARFLESEIMSSEEDEEEPKTKRQCLEVDKGNADGDQKEEDKSGAKTIIESAVFNKIPTEILHHILKYLSSEDLLSCSLVCKSLNVAASDESLWRCLYHIRWGSTRELSEYSWKKLYMNRDKDDTNELVKSCPADFKEYYIQMLASKRSQAPLPSQMVDESINLDKTVLEQVSLWKKNMGLADKVVTGHDCSGENCSYHQIGNMFICRETGNVHVCGDKCKGDIFGKHGWVCTFSGHCLDTVIDVKEDEEISRKI